MPPRPETAGIAAPPAAVDPVVEPLSGPAVPTVDPVEVVAGQPAEPDRSDDAVPEAAAPEPEATEPYEAEPAPEVPDAAVDEAVDEAVESDDRVEVVAEQPVEPDRADETVTAEEPAAGSDTTSEEPAAAE